MHLQCLKGMLSHSATDMAMIANDNHWHEHFMLTPQQCATALQAAVLAFLDTVLPPAKPTDTAPLEYWLCLDQGGQAMAA
jgi:hypothetical protein